MRKDFPSNSALFPMPVILIATYNEDGSVDVMNAAWGCAYDVRQVFLNLSPEHKTCKNIARTKAFSIALADERHVAEADYVGIVSANNTPDKFKRSGLCAVKGEKVNAPILEDFGVIMECELNSVTDDNCIIGDVKRLAVDTKYLDDKGNVDVSKLGIIAYDPFNHGYYVVERKVGQAFADGRKLK